MLSSHKIRVGVLRGGPSNEYSVSLESGKNVLANLPEEHYTPVDIFISRSGVWHEAGLPKSPENILRKVDVAFNALHGKYGEDGQVAKVIEQFNIPYTGSKPFHSAFGLNKILAKKIYKDNGIKTPFSINVPLETLSRQVISDVYTGMPGPFVVKPATSGSSIGLRVVYSKPELEEAIVSAFEYSPQVLVEEFIKGKEATCGIVEGFRGDKHYSLLPIEIKAPNDFFDYDSKYNGKTEEICPGNFSKKESDSLQNIAVLAHQALNLRHYSRSDFRVHPTRGIFILETNSLPGLTKESLIPKSLSEVGAKFSDFLHHVVQLALNKK